MKKVLIALNVIALCSIVILGCNKTKRHYTISQEDATISAQLNDIKASITELSVRVEVLENNVGAIYKDGNNLVLEGCNLVVRDGNGEEVNQGVGNIIVGRDEFDRFANFYGRDPVRIGSNNIIVGGSHEYTGSGGVCVGALNLLNSDGSCVLSCENTTEGEFATVTGGTNNKARGRFSSISGGCNKTLDGYCAWCAGNYYDNGPR